MELIKVETKNLANAELREELSTCNNLFANIKGNQKQIAISLGKIIVGELYKSDFEKLSNFLRYIGLNKSTATQFKKFVEYTSEDLIESNFSYSQIVEMFPLVDCEQCTSLSLNIVEMFDINESMTCREIRDIVKYVITDEVEAIDSEAEAEAEAEVEVEAEEAEAEEAEAEESIDYSFYIEYLTSLEVGTELTKDDIKILKMIARELR